MASKKEFDARTLKVESELLLLKQYSDTNLKIKPDYAVIKTFLNVHDVNEDEFRGRFESIIDGKEYKQFITFLECNSLSSDHTLYFFWVYLSGWYKGHNRAYENEDYKRQNLYNKEVKKLKDKFDFVQKSQYCLTPEPYNLRSININFISESGISDSIKITSGSLMMGIFETINEWLTQFKTFEQSEVKNKLHYFKTFIYRTVPFIDYLKANHFKSKPNMRVYEFTVKFLETIGINWTESLKIGELPEQYLKARYNEFKRANKVTLQK